MSMADVGEIIIKIEFKQLKCINNFGNEMIF